MRSSGSASWSSEWTSLTLTGAFKLYIRVAIFITAGPDVRVTTKPAPSGHRRVTAQLLPPHPHSRSLGLLPAGQRGQNAGNADGRAPNCVQVRLEAQKTGERPDFNKGAETLLRSRAAHALMASPYLSAGYMWGRTKNTKQRCSRAGCTRPTTVVHSAFHFHSHILRRKCRILKSNS